MPIPFILGAAAAIAGAVGVGTGIHGAVKMKDAKDTMEVADYRHKKNLARFEEQSKTTNHDMDELGTLELNILKSFQEFSDVFEKVKNKPKFKDYERNDVKIPKYDGEQLKEVSVGAGVLLGGLGGAAAGTAGGFAAAGATSAAVAALACASTGTPIAMLSGAAATNATLAVLGGGTLAAGGGGIALGTTILSAATLGVGLLVGGVIFNFTGSSLSDKADEAYSQMKRAEAEIDRACNYMEKLSTTANKYRDALNKVNKIYMAHLTRLKQIVNVEGRTDYNYFSSDEQLLVENSPLLVGLLYKMCKVQIVQKAKREEDMNEINHIEITKSIADADKFLSENESKMCI